MRESTSSLIDVSGLRKQFGARIALHDLSLTVQQGEIFGLVGANGGGKSTTLRMLAGLLKPDAGSGTIMNTGVMQSMRALREHIGYAPQGFSLFPTLTVAENLYFRARLYSLARPKHVCEQAMQSFGLTPWRNTKAVHLSGGWKTLLQIAAVTLHRPALLLLDEPTAGLDIAHRQQLWHHLAELAQAQTTIVISTHDLGEAQRCSGLALLISGHTRAHGTADDIVNSLNITTVLISGDDLRTLAALLEAKPDVLAVYRQSQRLRVICEAAFVEKVKRLAHHHACHAVPVPATFEDAALVLGSSPYLNPLDSIA